MTLSLNDSFLGQLGLEAYPLLDTYQTLLDPHKDAQLVQAFQRCDFSSVEKILGPYTNANQKLFLTEELIEEIIKAQIDNIFSEIPKMSRYSLIFDRDYSAEDKELMLKIKDKTLDLDELSEVEKKQLALGLLKKDFGPEFRGESQVTLLWAAVLLGRFELVKILLFSEKPADPYAPLSLTQLFSNKEAYLFSIYSWSNYGEKYLSKNLSKILRCFLEIGISKNDIVQANDMTAIYLSMKREDFDLLVLALDCGCKLNLAVSIDNPFFNSYEINESDKTKFFPNNQVTPLRLAIYTKNVEMIRLLLSRGAPKSQLSIPLLKILNELCPEMSAGVGELVKV